MGRHWHHCPLVVLYLMLFPIYFFVSVPVLRPSRCFSFTDRPLTKYLLIIRTSNVLFADSLARAMVTCVLLSGYISVSRLSINQLTCLRKYVSMYMYLQCDDISTSSR